MPAAAPTLAAGGPAPLQRILLASDGSPGAGLALQRLLALRGQLRDPAALELHVVNVQRPVSGDVASFVPKTSLEDYHHERAEQALQSTREALKAAGMPFQEHLRVGDPGPTIAELASATGCDLIVMGAQGLGSHTGGLLGSVAARTLQTARMPVLVVRS
ncbi:universal stress protein [Azohydromonas caseinilytica]|uniref:universal stress protein n=1 Tax=Azohydromonas caseinilytica TaxID=2728836 RepID=UPI002872E63D|nr:universal stress protein [Azohydromonas caseinilytica]